MYFEYWSGLSLNKVGEIKEISKEGKEEDEWKDSGGDGEGETVEKRRWKYAAAVTAESEGREEKIEVEVPTSVVFVGDMEVDLEPSWDDVVRVLKGEVSRRNRSVE